MTAPAEPEIGQDGGWPMPDGAGPCRTWPAQPGCSGLDPDPSAWTSQHRRAVEAATELLWRLTAGQFGLCQELIRPCHYRYTSSNLMAAMRQGRWIATSCACRSRCQCFTVSKIELPGPVYWAPQPGAPGQLPGTGPWAMTVWIDGAELGAGNYRLLNGARLLRTDGEQWPAYQHIDRTLDQPGTFGIQYWRGTPVPTGGRRALATLAWELYRAACGDDDCRLPDRVREVSREGVTYMFTDPQEFLTDGRTGITEVDLWLATVNPRKQRSPGGVWSPDLPQHVTDPHGAVNL